MENANPNNTARVQYVAKASSDQLLRKFAEVGSQEKNKLSTEHLPLAKRLRRSIITSNSKNILSESKSLLPRHAPLVKRIRAREIKNKSITTVIGKTWRKTVERASRALMEKHYNRHKRLISDTY